MPQKTQLLSCHYSVCTQTLASTNSYDNRVRNTGGYPDTGLDRLGMRDDDPAAGRFIKPDPTGQNRATSSPATTLQPYRPVRRRLPRSGCLLPDP